MIEIKLDRLIDDMRLLRSQMFAFDRHLRDIEASLKPSEPSRTALLAMLVVLLLPAPAVRAETAPPDRSKTVGPISAELAKKCRALAIKAHPNKPAGRAYAQAQRDYFQDCIAKGGNMPD